VTGGRPRQPAALSIDALVKSMVAAARGSLGRDWSKVRKFAEPQLENLARSLVNIGEMTVQGAITTEEATALLEIHKHTTRVVLLTAKGLGLLAVENAINAALGAVRDTVNGALGVALL
jgi:hypothetical protein